MFFNTLRSRVADGDPPAVAVAATAPAIEGANQLWDLALDLDAQIGGPGPQIAKLLALPRVSDVLINGTTIWMDRDGRMERVDTSFSSDEEVRALAVRMAAAAGTRLDEAMPIADGTLPDGTRLHAVLSPPATNGPLISLRVKRRESFSLDELLESGSLKPDMFDAIKGLISVRANVLVSGATGTGKTTLLSAVLSEVDANQRIICIEEVPELRTHHPHVVSMCMRGPNVQGEGAVTLADLVRAAMRMRPDRLVLGECRGGEVRDVLSALNTGHEGGWATIHANAPRDVPARLVALGSLAGMSDKTVLAQASAALDSIIHITRTPAGERIVEQIAMLEGAGSLQVVPALGQGATGKGLGLLKARLAGS